MAETERPKRLRGAKRLEEGYRAGYADGINEGWEQGRAYAQLEQKTRAEIAEATVAACEAGVAKLRNEAQAKPKRTRRTKVRDTEVDTRADANEREAKTNGL